ncbi:EpsG family protein [Cellulophaga tyrosinoxydans]|uniref:EpsG family protein n=1 Tax=Cellulophaga tyrosinoxydans TaxID=504486 RepID=A0A1W1YQL9_9FLAO|nr:EpsG family protein [Cellulophaga tyrosinoxydans]SMC38412.1 EpsG family protein [Cellulophaga tyrosinoxydans]
MWFYIFLFTGLSILTLSRKEKPKLTLILIMGFLIVIAGFRGNIDNDYLTYVKNYTLITTGKPVLFEPFFIVVSLIIKFTINNVIGVFVLFAIFGVGLKYLAIKKLSDFWLCSILVYYSYFYFLHDMTQIRTSIASAILLLAIPYIRSQNIKMFLLLVFLGAMSHYSLIAILPMYFISTKKVENIFYFLIPVAYLLFYLNINISSLIGLVNSFYEGGGTRFEFYAILAKNNSIEVLSVLQLIHIILCYIFLWKWKFLSKKNAYFIILLKFYIIGTSLYVAFADIPALGIRFSELFHIVEIILIPMLIYLTKKKIDAKFLIIILSLFSLLLLTFRLELFKPYFN